MEEARTCSVCGVTAHNLVYEAATERWLCEGHHAESLRRRETYAAEYSIYELLKKHPIGYVVPMPPESNVRGAVLVKTPPVPRRRKVQPPQDVVIIFILHPHGIAEAVFENGELVHRKTYFPSQTGKQLG